MSPALASLMDPQWLEGAMATAATGKLGTGDFAGWFGSCVRSRRVAEPVDVGGTAAEGRVGTHAVFQAMRSKWAASQTGSASLSPHGT